MDIEAAKTAIEELEQWIKEHDGDVDPSAFEDACAGILRLVFPRRIPAGIKGAIALDVACCLAGVWTPLVVIESRLPGAKELRAQLEA